MKEIPFFCSRDNTVLIYVEDVEGGACSTWKVFRFVSLFCCCLSATWWRGEFNWKKNKKSSFVSFFIRCFAVEILFFSYFSLFRFAVGENEINFLHPNTQQQKMPHWKANKKFGINLCLSHFFVWFWWWNWANNENKSFFVSFFSLFFLFGKCIFSKLNLCFVHLLNRIDIHTYIG